MSDSKSKGREMESMSGAESAEGSEVMTPSESTERSSSTGMMSRRSLTISTYHTIVLIDRLLSTEGDTRQSRLQKVSAFLIAVFNVLVVTLYTVAGAAAGSGTLTSGGLVFSIIIILLFLAVAGVLVRTKSVRWARVYGHCCSAVLTFVAPPFVIWQNGVGLVDDDGAPKAYQLMYFIPTPALIAFLLRSRRPVFAYASVIFAWLIVGTVWNPRGDDLTGVVPSLLIVLMSYIIVTFALGMFMDVAETLRDENESVTARSEVAEAEARAERRANQAKTRFVSVMSHEIRNPLQAILLQLEMLELSKLTDGQRDYVSGITRASNSLLTIVNDILEVTKIESGALVLEATPVVLRDVVECTVHSYAPGAANKGVELIVNIDPDLETSVITDPTRFRQVLRNLLSNALKFTKAGEIEVTLDEIVTLGEAPGGDDDRSLWALRVRDTGIGIDDEGKAKLFQEFSQVDETTTRLYGGTGLGLFICKELCQAMGGSIEVESTADVGSTFCATMSAVRCDPVGDGPPVRIVSSEVKWTVLVHASNETLRQAIGKYVSYFFAGVATVRVEFSDKVRTGQRRVTALLADCSRAHRLVVVANYTDCSSGMLALLAEQSGTVCVPVMLSSGVAGLFPDDPYPIEFWRNVVQKPATVRQLCSTLERAIVDMSSTGSESVSLAASASSRKLSDGTLTCGMRLPSPDEMALAAAEQAAARPGHSTILVADDFDLIRSLVQQLVSQMGFNTLVATNGKEALDLVREHYDSLSLVLMDCEMPVLDGYTATQEIRRYEQDRGIPASRQLYVCAMTANAMQGDAKKCFANQMSGFLAKPVRRIDLQDKLREHAQLPSERGIGGEKAKKRPRKKKKNR
jgi:signal transduction histidine kinase/CheY-like chemotaxis protein